MRCTACEKQKEGYLCPECGFDESCNYELFRTFAPADGRTFSISGFRKEKNIVFYNDLSRKADYTCPVCGFDESCNYEIFCTFAPIPGRSRSLSGYRKLLANNEINDLSKGPLFHQQKGPAADGFEAGSVVEFGSYMQSRNGEKEPIEWIVLAKENGKALLISRYALECQKYNNKFKLFTGVTWENCALRKWLNEDFYNMAFSSDEQGKIQTTIVTADKNPIYGDTSPGNDTYDKLFLLSITEAEKYFSNDEAKKCAPTRYAKEQGASTSEDYKTDDSKSTCYWWLRTPGKDVSNVGYVNIYGNINYNGSYASNNNNCVRPALWLNL